MKEKIFTVVGGDMRLVHLLRLLRKKPWCGAAHGIFLEQAGEGSSKGSLSPEAALAVSDVVIFGLPMLESDGKIKAPLARRGPEPEEIFSLTRPDAIAFGGAVPQAVATMANRHGIELFDYMLREEFSVRNAIPTAEGAVGIALRERASTLYASSCLVLGYGRIGRALTRLLTAFGAHVMVTARRPADLEWIAVAGGTPIPSSKMDCCLSERNIIFNTVPALLLDEGRLTELRPDCLVIDLASEPGGVDLEAAKRLGLHVERALSLPGKLAPVSAGEIILDTISNMLQERGLLHE